MEIKERGYGSMLIGGKERGFHIGTYQAKVFCDERSISLDDYLETISAFRFENSLSNNALLCDIIHSALVAYCEFNDEPIDFTRKKVWFWVDSADIKEVAKVIIVMREMDRNVPKK